MVPARTNSRLLRQPQNSLTKLLTVQLAQTLLLTSRIHYLSGAKQGLDLGSLQALKAAHDQRTTSRLPRQKLPVPESFAVQKF